MAKKDSPEQTLFTRQHPDYRANYLHHMFLRTTYDGGPVYMAGNLFRYPAEPGRVYNARKMRAIPSAVSCRVVETYIGYIFKSLQCPRMGYQRS